MTLATSLISYWKLDSNSNDSVGSNNGTDTAISYATAGKIGNCATFNGSTSKIVVNDSASLRFIDNFTISCWFNMAQDSSFRYLFSKSDFSGGYHGWDIVKMNSGNTIRFEVLTGASTAYDIFSNGAIKNSQWQHCVCIMESGTLKMYIDGVLQTDTQAGSSMTVSTVNMEMGNSNAGSIDECAIWSRALTADEVSALYNSGNGNQYPFSIDYVMSVLTGAFTLTGNNVNLTKGYVMQVATGVFNLVGNTVNLTLVALWNNIAKSVTSWTNSSKSSTTWNNDNKNTTNWNNISKS